MLRKNEAIEHELRKSVKEAEFQRRRKEKEVEQLREDLIRKKRNDAKKIHDAIARAEDEEKQLHRHLVRETTKLDDVRQTVVVSSLFVSLNVPFSFSPGATTVNHVYRAIETTDAKHEHCATLTNGNICVCYAYNLDLTPCIHSILRSELCFATRVGALPNRVPFFCIMRFTIHKEATSAGT